jgi:hypothetical protein
MKFYVILLCVLYLATILKRTLLLLVTPPPFLALTAVLDLVVLGLDLWGALCFAFNKPFFAVQRLRLMYQGTLVLGVASVTAQVAASGGVEQMGFGPLGVALSFLPYVLFAAPIILFDRSRRENET